MCFSTPKMLTITVKSTDNGTPQKKVIKNFHQYQSKLEHLLVRSTFTSPAQGLDFGASRKSYSMVNIHHKSPSPRNSLTPFDVYTPTSHRPRSSLTIRGDRDRGPHGQGHYSFHWRRRSTSFLQKCNPRKYRQNIQLQLRKYLQNSVLELQNICQIKVPFSILILS